jgi:hypothetical protein
MTQVETPVMDPTATQVVLVGQATAQRYWLTVSPSAAVAGCGTAVAAVQVLPPSFETTTAFRFVLLPELPTATHLSGVGQATPFASTADTIAPRLQVRPPSSEVSARPTAPTVRQWLALEQVTAFKLPDREMGADVDSVGRLAGIQPDQAQLVAAARAGVV